MARRATGVALCAAALLGVVAVGAVLRQGMAGQADEAKPLRPVAGSVLDEDGRPVPGAAVDLGDGVLVRADAQGGFSGQVRGGARLVTASAPDHLPRTQAAEPGGAPLDIRLTGQAASTVSLRFGGDVMFGRRYFDLDEDGDRSDGALPPGATVADHSALLRHVEPLLADADLTVVNLETPLDPEPWLASGTPRPERFHPTKELVFASGTESARGLLDVGVDAVSLGNNHVYDALASGLDSTLRALDRAGVPHFGAGRSLDEAWAPAYVERRGQRVALLSCTTDTGSQHPIAYVADAQRGGAAGCEQPRLEREVRAARAQADAVVVMVHGGVEYQAEQTEEVRGLSRAAVAAGATMVVNGHPHVVGRVGNQGTGLVAESMGNLLFEQTVWPSFLSYLLRVDVRNGVPVLATVDPLLLEGEVPRPTTGLLADAAARRATPAGGGEVLLRGPGAVLAPGPPRAAQRRRVQLPPGSVRRLAPGWSVVAVPPERPVALGEDLLWTGSFEDMDTDPQTPGAHQWRYSRSVERVAEAACSGDVGMLLRRSPASTEDVVLTPTHRQLIRAGTSVSLLADVQRATPGATLELALFGGMSGPSLSTLRVPVPEGEAGDTCRRVRLDVTVPPGTVAVQPFLRLAPRGDGLRAATLAVDDVLLVAWAPAGSSGRRYGVVEAAEGATVELADDWAGSGSAFTG